MPCPTPAALAEAGKAVGYQNLQLDPATHSASLLREHMLLDLGGIAMGYTVDEVLGVLARQGIRQALVDGSGDIGVGDPPPGKKGWTIGIAPPTAGQPPTRYVTLANAAITTSGDMFQHVDIGGVRYSHIVDPKTGLGLTDQSSVTLIARDCLTADSVTKAIAVERARTGTENGGRNSGAEVLIRRMAGDQMETYESPGFKAFRNRPGACRRRAGRGPLATAAGVGRWAGQRTRNCRYCADSLFVAAGRLPRRPIPSLQTRFDCRQCFSGGLCQK